MYFSCRLFTLRTANNSLPGRLLCKTVNGTAEQSSHHAICCWASTKALLGLREPVVSWQLCSQNAPPSLSLPGSVYLSLSLCVTAMVTLKRTRSVYLTSSLGMHHHTSICSLYCLLHIDYCVCVF